MQQNLQHPYKYISTENKHIFLEKIDLSTHTHMHTQYIQCIHIHIYLLQITMQIKSHIHLYNYCTFSSDKIQFIFIKWACASY